MLLPAYILSEGPAEVAGCDSARRVAMRRSWLYAITAILISALVLPFSVGCSPVQAAEGYVILVPQTMHAGSTESVSFNLYGADGPVRQNIAGFHIRTDMSHRVGA